MFYKSFEKRDEKVVHFRYEILYWPLKRYGSLKSEVGNDYSSSFFFFLLKRTNSLIKK